VRHETQEYVAKTERRTMRTYEELQKIYDKKKVSQIEAEAKETQGKSKDIYVVFLETLFYLERSHRFRENPTYTKSSFETYIQAEYGMSHRAYLDHRQAYAIHPDIAFRHSPALFASAKKKCGAEKVGHVFKEVQKKERTLNRPIRVDEIKAIIHQNAKPTKPAAPKPDITTLQVQVEKTQQVEQELKAVEKTVLSKDEQIEKLKAAVLKYKTEAEEGKRYKAMYDNLLVKYEALEREHEMFRDSLAPLVGLFAEHNEQMVAVQ
jgi:hypothetical protein